jgi:hypothetical protein
MCFLLCLFSVQMTSWLWITIKAVGEFLSFGLHSIHIDHEESIPQQTWKCFRNTMLRFCHIFVATSSSNAMGHLFMLLHSKAGIDSFCSYKWMWLSGSQISLMVMGSSSHDFKQDLLVVQGHPLWLLPLGIVSWVEAQKVESSLVLALLLC